MRFLQTAKSSRPLLSGHLLSVLSPASVQGSGSQDITLAHYGLSFLPCGHTCTKGDFGIHFVKQFPAGMNHLARLGSGLGGESSGGNAAVQAVLQQAAPASSPHFLCLVVKRQGGS